MQHRDPNILSIDQLMLAYDLSEEKVQSLIDRGVFRTMPGSPGLLDCSSPDAIAFRNLMAKSPRGQLRAIDLAKNIAAHLVERRLG